MFLDLINDQQTLNSTGDNQGCHKTSRFTATVWRPSQCQKYSKYIILLVLPSYVMSLFVIFTFNYQTM